MPDAIQLNFKSGLVVSGLKQPNTSIMGQLIAVDKDEGPGHEGLGIGIVYHELCSFCNSLILSDLPGCYP